jgi:hypothetical protein
MDEETQKIITEQMKKLPKDVMDAIISVDYKTKLQEITKRQRLMIDQAGKLEMETTLVMIGLEPLNDFVDNIEREFGVNSIRAKEIAMDVSEHIFKPIRDSLQKMNDAAKDDDGAVEGGEIEPPATKFTNTTEPNLNRDQILNEIENPIPNHSNFSKTIPEQQGFPEQILAKSEHLELDVPPSQTLETVPGQEVKDVAKEAVTPNNLGNNIVESKMTSTTITPQQIVNAKPEIKLPEIDKKRPTSGADPYREALS